MSELLWLGQSAVRITTPGGKVIVVDPFLTQNPKTPPAYKSLDALGKVDLLLVTHAHGDHLGDAPALARMHKAPLFGFRIYHMGDTGLFGDLRLIGERHPPDLLLIPIGGHYVMDPQDAAFATREWLKPRFALPIHYGTNPQLKGTPEEYKRALGAAPTKVLSLQPGETVSF